MVDILFQKSRVFIDERPNLSGTIVVVKFNINIKINPRITSNFGNGSVGSILYNEYRLAGMAAMITIRPTYVKLKTVVNIPPTEDAIFPGFRSSNLG